MASCCWIRIRMADGVSFFPFKLVRDKIPEIIRENGGVCVSKTLGKARHQEALLIKLVEEAEEVLNSKTHQQRKEELADLLEVMLTTQVAFNYSPSEIDNIRKQKFALRGGFMKGLFVFFTFGGK